jgi:phenylpyruvate tautomerase PptA (4-oxalocrotonate tautomerase family)
MIDIVAPEGTFLAANEAVLLERATACLLQWEKTASIPLAVANTGAFLHLLPVQRLTAGGKAAGAVRVQVLTPEGALTQAQRDGLTGGLTSIVAELATDPTVRERTWVLFSEAVDGGWGIAGKAYTRAGLGEAIRASLQR